MRRGGLSPQNRMLTEPTNDVAAGFWTPAITRDPRVLNWPAFCVMVKPARYTNFDPDRWWETRGGILELQKLFFDIVLHPISF
jgi:hypothetical protein